MIARKLNGVVIEMPRLKNMRHEKFAREYVKASFNATTAAKKCGYSEETAYSQGSRLLKDVNIMNRVMELNDDWVEQTRMSVTEIIEEIEKMARFDNRELYEEFIDDEGNQCYRLKHPATMDDDSAVSVNEVEMVNGKVVKVKAGKDKRAALDMLMKHHNLYIEHQKAKGEFHFHIDEKDAKA